MFAKGPNFERGKGWDQFQESYTFSSPYPPSSTNLSHGPSGEGGGGEGGGVGRVKEGSDLVRFFFFFFSLCPFPFPFPYPGFFFFFLG